MQSCRINEQFKRHDLDLALRWEVGLDGQVEELVLDILRDSVVRQDLQPQLFHINNTTL